MVFLFGDSRSEAVVKQKMQKKCIQIVQLQCFVQKDSVMKTASTVQENAEDILAEAKQINEERAAKEAALEQEAEEVTEETVADNTDLQKRHKIKRGI